MHKGFPCRHRVFVEAGFWSVAAGWSDQRRVGGFLTLWREGYGIYCSVMEYKTLVGLIGDLAVEGDLGGPMVYSRVEQPVHALSGSARTQAQNHSPHPPHERMSRQSHDRETREQNLSSTIATRVSHDPENDHETGIRVAFAPTPPNHTHPQITHTPKSHTHMQQVAGCIHVHIGGAADEFGRGMLARIDRKLLAGLPNRATRTLPLRIRPQVQTLPRPVWSPDMMPALCVAMDDRGVASDRGSDRMSTGVLRFSIR